MDYPKKINFRRYAVYIVAAWLLCFYLFLVLLQNEVYDSVVIESGQTSFVAAFEDVNNVVVANTDPEMESLLEEYPVAMTAVILNAEGDQAAYLETAGGWIDTDGFVSTEDFQFNGCSFQLTVGETYTLQYWAYVNIAADEQIFLDQLSFVIYGSAGEMTGEAAFLGIFAFIVMAGLLMITDPSGKLRNASPDGLSGHEHEDSVPRRNIYKRSEELAGISETAGYIAIYLAIAAIMLMSVPSMNESKEERTAFAQAYSFSSALLGRETTDEEGYVYIEEDGIRLMGQMSLAQSLHRFWINGSDGNQRSDEETCTLYQVGSKIPSPTAVLDGAAIAVARLCKAPYQLVYLAGPLLNLGIGFILYLAVLWILRRRNRRISSEVAYRPFYQEPLSLLCLTLFLLPSMMYGVMSYRGYGLYVAAILLILLALREYLPSVRILPGILCAGGALCVIWIIRTLMAGANPVLLLVRSIAANIDEWLLRIVYGGPKEPGELALVCLVILMLSAALWLQGRGLTADMTVPDNADPGNADSGNANPDEADSDHADPCNADPGNADFGNANPDEVDSDNAPRRYLTEVLILLIVYIGFCNVGGVLK